MNYRETIKEFMDSVGVQLLALKHNLILELLNKAYDHSDNSTPDSDISELPRWAAGRVTSSTLFVYGISGSKTAKAAYHISVYELYEKLKNIDPSLDFLDYTAWVSQLEKK